ncbi:MAG: hypothetical protein GY711_18645 [bacterium]|nr:hypothetical protein [bacterium]
MPPHVLVTGFGAFEGVEDNPSGQAARALDGTRVPTRDGVELGVRGIELPVTFRGAPEALEDALLAARPVAIVATGVHRGPCMRLERRAGASLRSGRPDNDGVVAESLSLSGPSADRDLETELDLDRLEDVLRASGAADVMRSEDAGGYVCECVYRRVLEIGVREGIPGLFLHVPPLASMAVADQLPLVRAVVAEVAAQISAARRS